MLSNRTRVHRARSGMMLIYHSIVLLALLAVASLAVDYAHVQLVKSQLQSAADAAALAGASSLGRGDSSSTAATTAKAAAADNKADGSAVSVAASDVTLGRWDESAHVFTAGAAPSNAVMVATARTAATSNPVALSFASIVGQKTCDAHASAVAYVPDRPDHKFYAIDSFIAQGLLTIDSFPVGGQGDVYCNGNIKLNLLGLVGLTFIDGDCRPGKGKSIQKPLLGITSITGSTSQLTNTLALPPVDASFYALHNNNLNLPSACLNSSGDFTALLFTEIPAGTYYVRDLNMLAGVLVKFDGPVTFYVTRNVTLAANVLVYMNKAANFRVKVDGAGQLNLLANVTTYMDLYAPESDLFIAAGVNYYGSIATKTITILGTSLLHYDESLGTGHEAEKLAIVK
jgi:Flp pilus assembly protein TadG